MKPCARCRERDMCTRVGIDKCDLLYAYEKTMAKNIQKRMEQAKIAQKNREVIVNE